MRALPMVAGAVVLALAWECIGRTHLLGASWPPLGAVLAYLVAPEHHALLTDGLVRTGEEALAGLATGTLAAVLIASLTVIVPPAAPGLSAFASIVNGVPVIAIAGICVLTLPHDATPAVVSALSSGFIVFVGASAALSATRAEHRDVFAVLGASRGMTFWRLWVPGAIPGIVDAVRSAAPASVVGAIVGEWFSAEHGLGPLLVSAMQNYAIEQLWAVALVNALLAMALFGVLGAVRAVVAARMT